MRRRHLWKAVASSLLAFSLVVGVCPVSGSPFVETVEAAELETVQTWNFDDGTTQSWSESGWSSTDFVGSTSNVDKRLKFTTDYTGISVGWYQGDIQLWDNNGLDCRGVSNAQMELYCKDGAELPTQIQVFLVNNSDTNTEHKSVCTMDLGDSTGTETISGETYKKYQLTGTFADNVEDAAAYKQTINAVIIQVVRNEKTFNGDVYFDNIIFQKESAGEGGVGTTGVVYEDAGPVVLDTTDTSSRWPSAQFNVNAVSGVTLPAGTVLQYDMEIADGKSFTDLVWGTKIGWEAPGEDENYAWNRYLASTNFTDNKRTEQITLDKEYKLNDSDAQKWGVQVWVNQRPTDDVGVVTCSALKITLPGGTSSDPGTDIPGTNTPESKPTIHSDLAVLNQEVTADPSGLGDHVTYQWYRAVSCTGAGTKIDGATLATYKPQLKDIGSWIYCGVIAADGSEVCTNYVRVVGSDQLCETPVKMLSSIVEEDGYVKVQNTSSQLGSFDQSMMAKTGYFRIEYTGVTEDVPQLFLAQWNSGTHKPQTITATSHGAIDASAGTYYAEYSYEDCIEQWGDEDFGELCAVYFHYAASDKDQLKITSVSWFGPSFDDGSIVLFTGEKSETGKQESLFYDYTKHVGGTFDTSKINYGSYFEAVYTGDKDKLILSLSSYSGGTNWIAVKPTAGKTEEIADGTYKSIFTIEDCINGNAVWGGFGTNMKRLDQIAVWTYDEENENTTITLKSLKYYPGTGEVVDKDGETKWTKKKTKGIGLIGDSIVHNPLVNTSDAMGEFKLGDWNKILGRSDCSNWGIGGQTTEHIKNRIADMLSAPYEYDTLVTLCGINDMGPRSAEEIVANYKEIYEQIHELRPTAKVYTISVLPTAKGGIYAAYNEDGSADASGQAKICEINRLLQELINSGKTTDGTSIASFVTFVDCHDDFLDKDAADSADRIYADPDYVFQAYDEDTKKVLDGLHPNEAGYRVIANKLKPFLPEEIIDENAEPEVIEISEPKTIEVTDATVNNWPYVEYSITDSGIIYTGTTVEYDVTVDNKDFTGIYLETDFNWEKVKTMTLTPADFGDSMTVHIKATFVGEPVDSLTGCQIKTGGDGMTYRGNLTCSNLKITPAKPEKADGADESAFEDVVIFTGKETIGSIDGKDVLKEVYTSGNFNMNRVMPGGYFYVEYQAPQKEKVILAFNDWEGGSDGWKEISTTESGKVSDGVYYAKFSYLACENALGSKNFSVVDAISVKVPDAAVDLTTIKWVGPKLPNSGNSDYGSSSDSGNAGSDTDKKQNEEKDKDKDKDKDNKGDSNSSGDNVPVIEKKPGQSQNHTVGGQDFVVTKGGKDGKAEVAFMDAPANAKKVVIPKTVVIDGVTCKVTSIAAEAFKGNTKITSVTISSNVKTIGDEAFAGCTSLKKVVVPASVTEIGDKAFYGCKKVETVTIGKNVTTINESAFEKCTSLKKVVISGPVKKIEENAFSGCKKLKKITITSTKLKSIGKNALKGLDKNAVIDVPDKQLKAYKKLFTAKTGFKKTMKLV